MEAEPTTNLLLQCERLPARLRVSGAQTVRCPGELDVAALLELTLAAAPGWVAVCDAGFCRTCPEGGVGELPGAAARREAGGLLAGMGLHALRPVVRKINDAGVPRDDEVSWRRERRGFLRRLALGKTPARAGPDAAAARAATLAALQRIAQAFGAPLPGTFFPALIASDRCRDHAICAALCGTGALSRYEAEGLRGLRFDPGLCTSCGDCARICPERALSLAPSGVRSNPRGVARLTSHIPRVCERCESEFVPAGDEALCPGCRKDAALAMTISTGVA